MNTDYSTLEDAIEKVNPALKSLIDLIEQLEIEVTHHQLDIDEGSDFYMDCITVHDYLKKYVSNSAVLEIVKSAIPDL